VVARSKPRARFFIHRRYSSMNASRNRCRSIPHKGASESGPCPEAARGRRTLDPPLKEFTRRVSCGQFARRYTSSLLQSLIGAKAAGPIAARVA